jgi:hypothetical protein
VVSWSFIIPAVLCARGRVADVQYCAAISYTLYIYSIILYIAPKIG